MTNKEFKQNAKKHQINYREKHISTDYKTYKTWLTDSAGKKGGNFYKRLSVFSIVRQRFPNFYVNLYSDMLRSEHIPFNLFIPFKHELSYCKDVFNELLGGCIKTIESRSIIDDRENIKIEFAPSPKGNYLNDRTSFDTYIEYNHIDGTKGIIGIEVKYTEKEYKLKIGSTEEKTIQDKSSKYYSVSIDSGLYKPHALDLLPNDIYRQIWRNHLLAESIRLNQNKKFKHSSTLLLYPKDNDHFTVASKKYNELLISNANSFVPVTYERFLSACDKYCPNNEFQDWIDYLINRYLI
ncbi:MAG: hypothetical protein GXO89_04700 [Chlorobi bacterium]|nr:hypothetical protein [Chlorobiota bacterium]